MSQTGTVLNLFITNDDENKTRIDVKDVKIDKDGIINDKFYAKNLDRSILITSTKSYELAKQNSIELNYGMLGENILIDIDPYKLTKDDIIKIGELEFSITQNCTLCKGLSILSSKLPKLLKDDRGIFCKLVSDSGKISVGDKVTIIKS